MGHIFNEREKDSYIGLMNMITFCGFYIPLLRLNPKE